jgi:hypothetical protein
MNPIELLQTYRYLTARRLAGELDDAAFQAAAKQLSAVDSAGRQWRIAPDSGAWQCKTGRRWVNGVPAEDDLPPDFPPPEEFTESSPPSSDKDQSPAAVKNVMRSLPPWALAIPALPVTLILVVAGLILWGSVLIAGGMRAGLIIPHNVYFTPTITAQNAQLGEKVTPSATITPTSTVTATPTPTVTATPTFTPRATRLPSATPTISPLLSSLAPNGPWLLVSAQDGLWAAAANGDALTLLESQKIAAPGSLSVAVSPAGGRIAYVVYREEGDARSLALRVRSLPGGGLEAEFPIGSGLGTQGGPLAPADAAGVDAVRALLLPGSLAWSPDGRSLAFTAAMDGPIVEPYVHSFIQNRTTRLARLLQDGQAFGMHWSPDGQKLVYFTADHFGTQNPEHVTGAWSIKTNGEGGKRLEVPTSQMETLVGWVSPEEAVVFSTTGACGAHNLRTLPLDGSKSTRFYAACFQNAAQDAESGNLMFAVSADDVTNCDCSEEEAPRSGVYLLPGARGLPRSLSAESVFGVRWQPQARLFYVDAGGSQRIALNNEGEKVNLPLGVKDLIPAVSPISGLWAWAQPPQALWVGAPNQSPAQVFSGDVRFPLWGAEGKTLLFFSGQKLYLAAAPQFTPQAVESFNSAVLDAVWVQP